MECPECGLPTDQYGPSHPWDCGPPPVATDGPVLVLATDGPTVDICLECGEDLDGRGHKASCSRVVLTRR